jgi:hypothetical protein
MNPLTFARMQAGMSKAEFPRKFNISRTYCIRAEQGCYVRPADRLLNFACSTLKMSHSEFMRKYREFQTETRMNSIKARDIKPVTINELAEAKLANQMVNPSSISPVGPFKDDSEKVTTNETIVWGRSHHPTNSHRIYMHEEFRKWRLSYYNSRVEFCAALCLHPTSVEYYEDGKYKSMPDQIEEVMIKHGLIGDLIPGRVWVYAPA